MGIERNIKLNNIQKDGQLNIDFNSSLEELLKQEKIEVARMYHIANIDDLIKKDGKWYFHDQTVEEYEDMMSGKDSDDIYKRN